MKIDDLTNVILFDGVCNLCNGTVNFLLRRDKKGIFRFAPLQSSIGAKLLKSSTSTAHTDSMVYVRYGKMYVRSTAVLLIFKDLGFPWNLSMIFFIIPVFIRDFFYNMLAKIRYRFFGKRRECMVPGKEIKGRFLD